METNGAELEKSADELLEGIRRVAFPSNIQKVVLEVEGLGEMISYRGVIDKLFKRLDKSLEYPILTRVRNGEKPTEGEYVIRVGEYLAQGKKGGLASLGTLVDETRKCNGKDE